MKKFIIAFFIFSSVFAAPKDKVTIEKAKALVKVSIVKKGDIAVRYIYYGMVTSDREALIYPDLPGKVMAVKVKEGDHVRKDQVVALIKRDIPGLEYKPLKVKSTIDGIVGFVYVKPGQMVAQQVPLMYIVDPNSLKIEVYIPQSDLSFIKTGKSALITVAGDTLKGVVSEISPAIDMKTREAKVYIKPTGKWQRILKPGMLVGAFIAKEESKNTLIVPLSALVKEGNQYVVFKVSGGIAHKKNVEIGIKSGKYVEIKSGIAEGDTVITLGAAGLSDGQPVEIGGEIK